MGFNSAFNPFNAELNPICHFMALLGAHHILHVSRVRVKELNISELWSFKEFRFRLSEMRSVRGVLGMKGKIKYLMRGKDGMM